MDNEAPPRRLTLLDAVVLIGAIAAGFAICRGMFSPRPLGGYSLLILLPSPGLDFRGFIILVVPFASLLTVALALLRLRRPRPSIRSLTERPGAVACGMVTFIIGLRGLGAIPLAGLTPTATWFIISGRGYADQPVQVWRPGIPLYPGFVHDSTAHLVLGWGVELGLSVSAAWLLLLIGGRWSAEPTWIDRGGRLAGAFWIAMLVVDLLVRLAVVR
jgi:hypothetical protein